MSSWTVDIGEDVKFSKEDVAAVEEWFKRHVRVLGTVSLFTPEIFTISQ